jgi:peroxiredoxin
LADDTGEWTAAIGMGCDSRNLLGGLRSERYAMIVQDGVVEYIESEPDIDKTTVTKSETLLEKL